MGAKTVNGGINDRSRNARSMSVIREVKQKLSNLPDRNDRAAIKTKVG